MYVLIILVFYLKEMINLFSQELFRSSITSISAANLKTQTLHSEEKFLRYNILKKYINTIIFE